MGLELQSGSFVPSIFHRRAYGAVEQSNAQGLGTKHTPDSIHFGNTTSVISSREAGVYDSKTQVFQLANHGMGYYMHVDKNATRGTNGELVGLHWGQPVGSVSTELAAYRRIRPNSWQHPLDIMPREFPDTGRGDNRPAAIKIRTDDGQTITPFKYKTHRVLTQKPEIPGLPSLRIPAQDGVTTTVVTLVDETTRLKLDLYYTVLRDYNAIIRSARLTNTGHEPVTIEKLASFSRDFDADDYKLLKLSGAQIRERQEQVVPLSQGTLLINSNLGASGHAQNPFLILMKNDTTATQGNAYGFSLVYSGSFSAEVSQSRNNTLRMVLGLNPETFQWKLNPGESFYTPEAIGVYSDRGIEGVSQQFHQLFQKYLVRSTWADKPRPIKLNTWEAIGHDVTHEKVLALAKQAKDLGVELMVLDDGWFGTEYPRTSKDALGDWVANPKRFPQGIQGIARDVHQQGMMFGIWVEPEMVSPNSLLFKQHSDWIIHQPNRFSTPVKHQYILDLGKKEVQDYLIKSISALIKEGDVDYLKWDMNRTMTEVGSSSLPSRRQMETQHRYMLGLYRVLDVLTRRFPDALFEGCAGGGGRFDPGMLQYFPQIWTSDNTDAVSRLHIQAGTARAYPPITMSAHVSNNPNGQVGRSTPLSFRCHVAMMGNFGIELNPAELTDDEKTYLRDQVALYKEIRPLIHHGNYSQLRGPESNWPSWQFTAPDQSEAVVFAFKPYAQTNNLMVPPLRLRNLDPEALYVVSGVNKPLTGAYLMHAGLNPNLETDANGQMLGDYTSTVIRIQKAAGSQKASALNLFV